MWVWLDHCNGNGYGQALVALGYCMTIPYTEEQTSHSLQCCSDHINLPPGFIRILEFQTRTYVRTSALSLKSICVLCQVLYKCEQKIVWKYTNMDNNYEKMIVLTTLICVCAYLDLSTVSLLATVPLAMPKHANTISNVCTSIHFYWAHS